MGSFPNNKFQAINHQTSTHGSNRPSTPRDCWRRDSSWHPTVAAPWPDAAGGRSSPGGPGARTRPARQGVVIWISMFLRSKTLKPAVVQLELASFKSKIMYYTDFSFWFSESLFSTIIAHLCLCYYMSFSPWCLHLYSHWSLVCHLSSRCKPCVLLQTISTICPMWFILLSCFPVMFDILTLCAAYLCSSRPQLSCELKCLQQRPKCWRLYLLQQPYCETTRIIMQSHKKRFLQWILSSADINI